MRESDPRTSARIQGDEVRRGDNTVQPGAAAEAQEKPLFETAHSGELRQLEELKAERAKADIAAEKLEENLVGQESALQRVLVERSDVERECLQVAKRFREEIGERVRIWQKLNQDDDFAFLTNTNATSTVLMAQDVLIQLMANISRHKAMGTCICNSSSNP